MTSANREIVVAFEENGLTPEQIAGEFDYELAAVKGILFSCSSLYRGEAKNDKTYEFTDSEYQDCKDVILSYARHGEENPALQVKCALFIVQDKKGYLDPRRALPQLNINVLDFNSQMKKAIEAEKRTRAKAIEITSEVAT